LARARLFHVLTLEVPDIFQLQDSGGYAEHHALRNGPRTAARVVVIPQDSYGHAMLLGKVGIPVKGYLARVSRWKRNWTKNPLTVLPGT
jgi:hypothetical protein